MAEIVGALVKMLVEELDQNSSNSEAVQTKIGANVNGLIDQEPRLKSQLFTGNGTWTCPAGVTRVIVYAVGGGGGGGGASGASTGGNGGDGGSTLFNSTTVATGGSRGYGAPSAGIDFYPPYPAAESGVTFDGSTYGSGGTGGIKSTVFKSGSPGKAGAFGVREFTVVPTTGYSVSIGTGGTGGTTNAGGGTGTGGVGATGATGALLVTWVERA